MKVRIVRDFKYLGCGFPVTIEAVAMGRTGLGPLPLIDYHELHVKVLMAVAVMPRRLTGKEVCFIRECAHEGYPAFAAHFGVTHASVIGWEKHGDEATNMNIATEMLIRTYAHILAGADADHVAGLLTKFILHRSEALKPGETTIRVSICTDPSTFGRKTKGKAAPSVVRRKTA